MANWTEADFANFYSVVKARVPSDHAEFGNTYPYGWERIRFCSRLSIDGIEEIGFADSWRTMRRVFRRTNMTVNKRTLIVGCGVGGTIHQTGVKWPSLAGRIWGTDLSSYIHTIKSVDAPDGFDLSRVLNIDITAGDAVTLFQTATGSNGKFGMIIFELVTETIPFVDRAAWFSAADDLLNPGGEVVHIVVSDHDGRAIDPLWTDEGWTYKPVAEWHTEYPSHYFIDISNDNAYRVPA